MFRIGGVFLTSHKSKIRVDNTLDKRLELLRQSATPEIRKLLFGQENEGKTFFSTFFRYANSLRSTFLPLQSKSDNSGL